MSENGRNKAEGKAIEAEVEAGARGLRCEWRRCRHMVEKRSVPLTEKGLFLIINHEFQKKKKNCYLQGMEELGLKFKEPV